MDASRWGIDPNRGFPPEFGKIDANDGPGRGCLERRERVGALGNALMH